MLTGGSLCSGIGGVEVGREGAGGGGPWTRPKRLHDVKCSMQPPGRSSWRFTMSPWASTHFHA